MTALLLTVSYKGVDPKKKLRSEGSRRRASRMVMTEYRERVTALAKQLGSGSISLLEWQQGMRLAMRESWTLQLVIGAGGDKSKIDSKEYLRLGTRLQEQYRYLERFAKDIVDKGLSEGQIAVRSRMYMEASKLIYWQMITGIRLPAYPGDGSTQCKVNCKCSWKIDYVRDNKGRVVAALATWVLGKAEHCVDCYERASKWVKLPVEIQGTRASTAFKLRMSHKSSFRLRVS